MPELDHEFFEEVRREHEELRQLLGQTHQTVTRRSETSEGVAEIITRLRTHIETHFEEEESAGFFDNIVERAPWLLDQVEALRQEHAELRSEVAGLQQLASKASGTPEWWQELDACFHKFSTDLMHHENSENDILQHAYSDDVGSAD